MKKVFLAFSVIMLVFQSVAYAADCSGAQNFLALIQDGLAKCEQTTSITTEYAWTSGWYP